jgi:effector-binding domain-containing protein
METRTVGPTCYFGKRQWVAATDIVSVFAQVLPAVYEQIGRSGIEPVSPPVAVYFGSDPFMSRFDMLVGCLVACPVTDVPGFASGQLPPSEALTVVHEGPYDSLVTTYQDMQDWMAAHGRQPSPIMWEVYLQGPETTADPAAYRTEVVWPVLQVGVQAT